MWIKYWTVGNGGLSGEVKIAELPDSYSEDRIEEYIEGMSGYQSSGYRGSRYKIVDADEIPPSYFEDEINHRDRKLQVAWEKFKEVPKLQKMKKSSERRLAKLRNKSLKEVLKKKEDYCYENAELFKPFCKKYIRIFRRKGKTYIKVDVGPESKEKYFPLKQTVDDVIEWANS